VSAAIENASVNGQPIRRPTQLRKKTGTALGKDRHQASLGGQRLLASLMEPPEQPLANSIK
jgi:hypothetical protein